MSKPRAATVRMSEIDADPYNRMTAEAYLGVEVVRKHRVKRGEYTGGGPCRNVVRDRVRIKEHPHEGVCIGNTVRCGNCDRFGYCSICGTCACCSNGRPSSHPEEDEAMPAAVPRARPTMEDLRAQKEAAKGRRRK